MVVHPPSTSQRQMTDAQLAAAGITPGLLRISVGLEDLEDLQGDLAQALARVHGRVPTAPQPATGSATGSPTA
jgi:O-acetylhomoserine (thiol)-lyase